MNIEVPVALLAEGVDRNWYGIFTCLIAARVALLAEGVDRNSKLSSAALAAAVALLAEGVDRNHLCDVVLRQQAGRPPRGGRG